MHGTILLILHITIIKLILLLKLHVRVVLGILILLLVVLLVNISYHLSFLLVRIGKFIGTLRLLYCFILLLSVVMLVMVLLLGRLVSRQLLKRLNDIV